MVETADWLFVTRYEKDGWTPDDGSLKPGGDYKIAVEASVLAASRETLQAGGTVDLGVIGMRADGRLSVAFAVLTEGSNAVYASSMSRADHDTAILHAYLNETDSALHEVELTSALIRLNEEADAPLGTWPLVGPLGRTLQTFAQEEVLGVGPKPIPWEEQSPECRTLLDAPKSVFSELAKGHVEIVVPSGWLEASDVSICLSTSLGSLGCALPDAAQGKLITMDDVLVAKDQDVMVQIADGEASWSGRITIGLIPYEVFADDLQPTVVLRDVSFESFAQAQDIAAQEGLVESIIP